MPKYQRCFDFVVLGAGIVGLASARQLQRCYPDARILVLEKEPAIAQHQTGRNSGVIHAGVYYAPGSLKADFCKRGALATKAFCQEQGIAVDPCGKLLVATDELELQRMQALYRRCLDNGIAVQLLSAGELSAREPNIAGVGAIWVPESAVVDYRQVCAALAEQFTAAGGELLLAEKVVAIEEAERQVTVSTRSRVVCGRYLLACAGLMADRVAGLMGAQLRLPGTPSGAEIAFAIVPFRGEYYALPAARAGLINHLIYPIPDPELPFLGVHLTKTIAGGITVGPNAVLGFKREGYGRFNFSVADSTALLGFAGLWPLLRQHWQSGWSELKDSWSKAGYLQRVRKYCPQLTLADLQPHPVGVRAQAVLSSGELVHDFLFAETERSLHVCNAPSPAATSAFPIAEYLVAELGKKIKAD
ncbi:L-2-hydroxyglutarate oxidase [Halioxenophilus sp. WMMB6]|uniref:L-2-hydroxyglutarate oxidase n=1 Tax=Halioxenophilus sp. WMMB6 TaxID=3073815 RepID=UPI00295E978B|nr:L-2-hydroxyglutarate oxidase [Halioxenophilus sp. WMMB6]